MHNELNRLINLYHESVGELFPRLAKHLDIKLPITNTEWTTFRSENSGVTECGIMYFIHGYGVCMRCDGIEVDFDLGDEGQIDGIDPWKLWSYIEQNNIQATFTSGAEIASEFKSAVNKGEIVYSSDNLYYFVR